MQVASDGMHEGAVWVTAARVLHEPVGLGGVAAEGGDCEPALGFDEGKLIGLVLSLIGVIRCGGWQTWWWVFSILVIKTHWRVFQDFSVRIELKE